ncbi:MAG: hypothetical protein WCK49_00220 [Myxococcaceae bacterium]
MKALFLLLIFLIGCDNVGFNRSDKSPSKPSAAMQAFADLVNRAIGLADTELSENFSPESILLIEQIYTDRFAAFITELKKDTQTQSNLIKLKNELMGFEISNPGLKPIEQAAFFEKIANNPKALKILIEIRNDLYGPDGKLLKRILWGAAHDPIKKQALISGQILGLCKTLHCAISKPENIKPIFSDHPYALDLIVFSQSKLKKDLDAFSGLTGEEGHLIEDEFIWTGLRLIALTDYVSLAWAHEYIRDLTEEKLKERLLAAAQYLKAPKQGKINQLAADLMPELREFARTLIEPLTSKDLQDLLNKLSEYLTQYSKNNPVLSSPILSPKPSIESPIRTHIRRLDDFAQELLRDPIAEQNLIEVKDAFLNSAPKRHAWSGVEWASFIDTIAAHPETISILLRIRDSLYGPDGQLLKKILLSAAHDNTERDAFLAGQAYNKCVKEHSIYQCLPTGLYQEAFMHYASMKNSDKILFSKTRLKADLDTFLEITQKDGELGAGEENKLVWACIKLLPILSYSSLSWLHNDIKKIEARTLKNHLLSLSKYLRDSKQGQVEALLSEFGPQIHETGHSLFAAFTGKSLKDLTPEELHGLLEQLDAFLGPH